MLSMTWLRTELLPCRVKLDYLALSDLENGNDITEGDVDVAHGAMLSGKGFL